MKKLLSILLVLVMAVSAVALSACETETTENTSGATSGTTSGGPSEGPGEEDPNATYTYDDSVVTLATNWNVHTYQNTDDAYPQDFLMTGLYSFIFNDESHKIEGKENYAGYVIVPDMAASNPVDVTEQIKASHPQFNIPEDATKGYAYTIDLNPDACWENGVAINADTYVYSMKQLLDPDLLNYRASDYYVGNLCIAGAEYYNLQGQSTPVSIAGVMEKDGLADLDAFLAAYGEANAYIDWSYSFGAQWDFEAGNFAEEITDSGVADTGKTLNEFIPFYVDLVANQLGWASEETAKAWVYDELYANWTYPDNVEYDGNVGCFKTGDYQITLVFGKYLAGFNLFYNLSGNWIVYQEYYDACKSSDESADGVVWSSTYCTSVETTMSYGPYKMTEYIADSGMKFEKNEKWYGYTDGKHTYVDPVDGQTYNLYQTTHINTRVVAEAEDRYQMFLKGELMTFGLSAEYFDQYNDSDYAYVTPSETIYFMILNGHKDAIANREAAEGFDKAKNDLETITVPAFRQAMALVYDKELFCSAISPARSGGYALLGESFIYDPETGSRYRDTDYAKQALCDFYGLDVEKDFGGDLDKAVESITGYDPALAKELFAKAFEDSKAEGYITDADNDGKCDQTIEMIYNMSADSDFQTQTVAYLNEKLSAVIEGTPFEGKITIVKSAPLGNEWSNRVKDGSTDLVLAGWSGSALDPYGVMDVYTNPDYQYDAAWFDATSIELTITVKVNGEEKELTASAKAWCDAMNGATVAFKDGNNYCFGDGIADNDTRLLILSKLEAAVLSTYNYIPMMQNASKFLLTKKAFYVVEEYNPVLGRGGIAYLKYNYSDEEWTAYVAEQGGQLTY